LDKIEKGQEIIVKQENSRDDYKKTKFTKTISK